MNLEAVRHACEAVAGRVRPQMRVQRGDMLLYVAVEG
jgi:hypothetical protein